MTTTRRSPATLQPAKPLSAPAPIGERSLAAAMIERFSSIEALVDRYRDDQFTESLGRMTAIAPMRRDSLVKAQRRLTALPLRRELEAHVAELSAAVLTPATRSEARAIVALCADGIPAAATQITPNVLDAITYTLSDAAGPFYGSTTKGFSTAVLAAAAQTLWRHCKFMPSPAEFLAAARDCRWLYIEALGFAERAFELLLDAEDVVAVHSAPTSPPLDDPGTIPF